jgi:hypothetical protein
MNRKTKSKKILVITTTPFFAPKGSALRVNSILKHLSLGGRNSIDLVAYPHGKDIKYKGVKYHRICKFFKSNNLGVGQVSFKKIFLDFFVFLKAFKLLLQSRYDIVHCEDFEAAFIGSFFHIFFRRPRYVYDLHNRVSDNMKTVGSKKVVLGIVRFVEKLVVKPFDLIILNWKQYEDDELFVNKKKFLLYDRADLGVENIKLPSKKYVAYSGNYKVYQGVEYFLRIYSKAKVFFDVVLVGNVTEGVVDLIKKLGIEQRVFCMGQLEIGKSNYVLKNSICCLIPKLSEEHRGLKIVHHVMLGKLSLASDISANRELLVDNKNALLYNSSKELIKKLEMIEKDPLIENKFEDGILETQKYISRIWSYEYFKKNYFDRLFK